MLDWRIRYRLESPEEFIYGTPSPHPAASVAVPLHYRLPMPTFPSAYLHPLFCVPDFSRCSFWVNSGFYRWVQPTYIFLWNLYRRCCIGHILPPHGFTCTDGDVYRISVAYSLFAITAKKKTMIRVC